MKNYKVTFERISRDHEVGSVTFDGVEDLQTLAARIEKFARPKMMSSDVEVAISPDGQRGAVYAGLRNAGAFTVEEVTS